MPLPNYIVESMSVDDCVLIRKVQAVVRNLLGASAASSDPELELPQPEGPLYQQSGVVLLLLLEPTPRTEQSRSHIGRQQLRQS